MKRIYCFLAIFLCLSAQAWATSVTATVVDLDGITWANATCNTTLIYKAQSPPVAPYLSAGGTVPINPPCTVNSSGQLSATLTDVNLIAPIFQATWQFTVTPAVYQGAGSSTVTIPVTGSGQDVSAQLRFPGPRVGGGVGAFAYADVEVTQAFNNFYWNVSSTTCRQYTTAWGLCANGAGGSGTVNSGNAYQVGCYPPGGGTTIGPCPNVYSLNPSMTLAQINAVFAAAGSTSLVLIGSVPQYQWNNVNDANVIDTRTGAMNWSNWFARKGVVCDFRYNLHGSGGYTLTAGSNQLLIGSDPYAVGSTMIFAQQVNFGTNALVQNVWMPKIVSFSYPNATLSGPAPFNYSGGAGNGTDNYAALQSVLNEAGYTFPVRIPDGCSAFTSRPLNWPGTSLYGSAGALLAGAPGVDVLQATLGEATVAGMETHNLNIFLNSQIDPTLGYTLWSQDGTTPTTVPPLYRPAFNNTSNANHPLTDQWVVAGSNGVAAITAGSAVMCVPNALGRTPANGQTVVFPYLPINALFTATVLNQTGAGCAGGSTGVTLSVAVPSLPTGTYTQSYYENGTSFDLGQTNISTTISYPLTITVSLPNAPDPLGTAAAWGHLIIGNNSERFEADYMGNNYSAVPGSGTFVLRKGPTTITNALTAGNYVIIPANPCQAAFETPPPVYPNINGSSSMTPAGAVDIPGGCVGNAAMSFPEPDGTAPSTGMVSSVIGPVGISTSSGQINNSAALYEQANAASYSVNFPDWKIEQTEWGITQGPASINNWGVAVVGPTATGNSFTNCQIHAAFPIVLSDYQQGNINRCDTYTTLISPYDGTPVGAATALSMSYSTNEQTGGGVTVCAQDWVNNWNSEPENGSHIAVPAFAYVACATTVFDSSNFEGALTIFNSDNITVKNSQLSLPLINYGHNNKFENNYGINPFWVTNNWADNSQQWFNWGYVSECSEQSTISPSMKTACGSGYYESYSGHSVVSGYFGNDITMENEKGGSIIPGEIAYFTAFQGPYKDSTEPYWGSYYLCAQVGGNCQENYFGGPFGQLYIGRHNRIGAAPYTLNLTVKQTTGSPNTFQILFGAFDQGAGTCTSPGQFGLVTVPITTSWLPQSVPVDFTGKAGCTLSIQVQTLTNPVEIGEMNFMPVGNSVVIQPPSDSIYNTSCPVNGKQYGVSSTGYSYVCVNGTIKRSGPYS